MKITDHKLSEGIALTFRVPEGNIKHPLIILCHGFCGIFFFFGFTFRTTGHDADCSY